MNSQPKMSTRSAQDSVPSWVDSLKADIIASLKTELKSLVEVAVDKIQCSVNASMETVAELHRVETQGLKLQISDQHLQIDYLKGKQKTTHDRLIRLESYSMRENLIFTGFDEVDGETDDTIQTYVSY